MAQPNPITSDRSMMTEFKVFEPTNPLLAQYQPRREPKSLGEYFCLLFPDHARRFGPPLLEATYFDAGLKRSQPLHLNEDFFCGVLGSNRTIGHHLVFYLPEQTFYFYDSRFDYYCATSEDKVMILLSQTLIHAAKDMQNKLDVAPLVVELRDELKLKQIIRRAKALLSVDEAFFAGDYGKRRKLGDRIYDPSQEPPQRLFIKEAIVPAPERILSVTDAYLGYTEFCRVRGFNAVEKRFFKNLIAEIVRDELGVGVRRDLKNSTGKYIQGWKGITCTYSNTLAARN